MSSKEKILSKNEELSSSEEPLLLDKDYNPGNIVNTSSSIEDDLERQLASFLEKEEAFKKNDITQKELIKKYEEEIKELRRQLRDNILRLRRGHRESLLNVLDEDQRRNLEEKRGEFDRNLRNKSPRQWHRRPQPSKDQQPPTDLNLLDVGNREKSTAVYPTTWGNAKRYFKE